MNDANNPTHILHEMLIAVHCRRAYLPFAGPKDDAAAQETKRKRRRPTARRLAPAIPSPSRICYKDPRGFVPLRKAQRYLQRPRPGADYPVPLQLVPVADGHHVQRARAVSTWEGEDRRQIDEVDVSQRQWEAGQVSLLPDSGGGHVSLLPCVRYDRLLGHCRRTGSHRNRNRHAHRPDISAAKDFRLRSVTGIRGR